MSFRPFRVLKALVYTLASVSTLTAASAQSVHVIPGDGSDVWLYDDGATAWIGQSTHRVGRGNHNSDIKDSVSLFVFVLPTLAPGDNITSAHLDFNSVGGSWSPPSSNMNLYGLGYRSSYTAAIDDFFQGPYGSDTTDATPIQQDFGITWPAGQTATANGTYGTDATGDLALLNYLKAQYTAGAQGGDVVILRLNLETPQTGSNAFWVGSASNENPPVLTIAVNGATVSDPPVADAGPDQSVNDDDGDGFASVTLDGSGSTDSDGTVDTYEWSEAGSPIATGVNPTVSLPVGNHTITLIVTDDTLMTDADDVVIAVIDPNANTDPVADAGPDQSVNDDDEDGFVDVTLDGSASFDPDANGSIVSYVWTESSSQIATGVNPTVNLSVGPHTITLTVTDDRDATDVDTVVIDVTSALGLQLLNLKDPPSGDRIPRPMDYVWPANHGEYDICLWNDDKWGAVSITIDDNTVPDHDWWVGLLDMYGWKATWFVVTSNLEPGGNSFFCCWPEFQRLADLGHDIQSHSVNHHSDDHTRPDAEVIYEYEQSQLAINANITGQYPCLTLAYPYGNGKRDIAAQYYIGNRGTVGGVNQANRIDYMQSKSGGASGLDPLGNIEAILTGSSTNISWLDSRALRGWSTALYHYVQDRPTVEAHLAALKTVEDKIWVGTFTEVTMFGQERDTAELNVTSTTADTITFTLSDDMMDSIFTFPLTIKFRVNNDWLDCTATQDGNEIESWIVTHEGNQYALVKAVPDQGEVTLTKGGSGILTRAVFYNNSSFDNFDAAANANDDNAVATDKQALLPGQTAAFVNYTSYDKGINGVIIDIAEPAGTLTAADFTFKAGNDSNPSAWPAAPAAVSVTTRSGEGLAGSDRVTIIFADGAITGQWLEISVMANANTGLDSDDVFYFGNAIGETGNSATDAIVDATDEIACRNNPRNFLRPATIFNPYDHNKDGKVDATDEIISRNHVTTMLNDLELISP